MVGLESSMESKERTAKNKSAEKKLLEQGWKKVHDGCYVDKSKRQDLYGRLMHPD